jgi:nucleoside-diphosphate-sugar epimerase
MMNKPGPIACVTGATGMIGSRIIRKLLASGFLVQALSRHNGINIPGLEWFHGEITDESLLEKFLQNSRFLFHCAAELRDQSQMWEVNVKGTERLLHQAHNAGVEFLCHLSSADVVGETGRAWVDEASTCNPLTEYERSKWHGEQIAAQSKISRIVILRPTMTIDTERPGILTLAMRGSLLDRLKLLIKGGEFAHQVHAEDVAAAALFFVDRSVASAQCYFVSLDDDPFNTVAGYWRLCQAYRRKQPVEEVKPLRHLPLIVPHVLRRLLRGRANRGDVRYSSRRLLESGFSFPLGVKGAVWQIMSEQKEVYN